MGCPASCHSRGAHDNITQLEGREGSSGFSTTANSSNSVHGRKLQCRRKIEAYLSALMTGQAGKDRDSLVTAKPLVAGGRACTAPLQAISFFIGTLLTWLVLVPVCVAHGAILSRCTQPKIFSCVVKVLQSYPKISSLRFYHATDHAVYQSLFKP